MQKQLEKRILEAEKMKQQEREERRKAMDAVEKQVSRAMRWNYVKCPVRYLSQSQCKEIKIQVEVRMFFKNPVSPCFYLLVVR